jgi:hypothetical protein
MNRIHAALALLAALLVPATAGAQTILDRCEARVCKANLTLEQVLGEAQVLIEAKRFDEAQTMIEALKAVPGHKFEVRFLSGMVAAGRGDHRAAVGFYKQILAEDPTQTRVRLELGREMLAMGHTQSADKQFKIAERDKDLPEDVAKTIRVVRNVIRSKRTWRLDLDFGIAPDSNINNATASDTVNILWGGGTLPLNLDPSARAKSGTGETASLSGGLRLPVARNLSAIVDADASGNNYKGATYDDYQVQLAAGAEVRTSENTSISLEALGAQRWYGGKTVSRQKGIKAGFQSQLNKTSQIGFQLDVRHTDALFDTSYDGTSMGAYLTYEHAVSKSLVASTGGFFRRDWLKADAYSSKEFGLILGFGGELPHGITFGLSGSASRAKFDAPIPLFSLEPRKDWRFSARASLGDRKIQLLGFSPQVSVSYNRTDSSLNYYANDRLRFRFTLARYF